MRRIIGLHMNRGRILFTAVLTVLVILVLALFVGRTIQSVDRRVMQSCFDELDSAAKQLAEEMYTSIGSDHTTLSAIATIIAGQPPLTDDELRQILNAYGFDSSYISYLEVLRPDNTMLSADGSIRDVSAEFDFWQEAVRGQYISGIANSTHDSYAKVIRHAVPIVQNGRTICILYGVVRLCELAETFTTDLYGGHAYVYIEDGDTGDFIVDTWNKDLGNIADLGARETLPGYKSIEEAVADMGRGVGGEVGFVSQSTGGVLYMHYEPIGINNWNVMITVEQQYALEKSESVSTSLYWMAGVIGAVLLFYVACVIACLFGAYRQVKKLGTEDQSTGLQNRNMFDKFVATSQNRSFASVTCVYVDVNGLHSLNNEQGHAEGDRMLCIVADALRQQFGFRSLFRIGGDEFVAFSETDGPELCAEKMRRVEEQLRENDYSISIGIVCRLNETGVERVVREADALMLRNKSAYYAAHDRRR